MACYACGAEKKDRLLLCKKCDEKHEKSPWVKAWRTYMADCKRIGTKKAVFKAPKGKK